MYENPVPNQNPSEKPPKRKFWQNLLIMDSGDLKKILSLSSMMLSFVLIFVYAAAYILLMPLLAKILGNAPVLLVNLAESLIPAILATGVIMLTWPLFRDKRVLPAAYLWMALFALVIFIGVMIRLRDDPAARQTFLYLFVWDAVPAILIGNAAAWLKYRSFLFQ